jgi:hypothetical protein
MGKTFTSHVRKILVACLLLVATGCDEDAVVWLPDSSGFIYTNDDGTQVLHFDIKRRAKRIILSHMGGTTWPGLSADGKRVAVADCTVTTTEGTSLIQYSLTVTLYSLEGEQLKRSKPITFTDTLTAAAEKSSVEKINVCLDWSGPANKILVVGHKLRIYDTVQDKFRILPDCTTWLPGSGSSVTPDKKGFLAFKLVGASAIETILSDADFSVGTYSVVYYDWDGWETDFEGDDLETILGQNGINGLFGSHWVDETTCVIEAEKGTMTVDLLKKTATASSTVRPSLLSTGKLVWRGRLGEKAELCAYDAANENQAPRIRVEIHIPSERKRREVLAAGEYRLMAHNFFPSPNGSLVAICCEKANDDSEESIIVVDAMGNIVANISTD